MKREVRRAETAWRNRIDAPKDNNRGKKDREGEKLTGFQSLSKMIHVSAAVRLIPTPPALYRDKISKNGEKWFYYW